MAADLFTYDDIKNKLGEEKLRDLVGDDGTGHPHPGNVAEAIRVTSEDTYGILRAAGWNNEQIAAWRENDPSIFHAMALMFRHNVAVLRDDFRLPDGSTIYAKDNRDARDMLRAKASLGLRSSAEEVPTLGTPALIRPIAGSEWRPRTFTGRGF